MIYDGVKKIFKKKEFFLIRNGFFLAFLILGSFFLLKFAYAVPVGPTNIFFGTNETRAVSPAYGLNISGGYIVDFNLSVRTQNMKWKGFVGKVTGSFALQDAVGSTLFDWTSTSAGGEIYATRSSNVIYWSNLTCANKTTLEAENFLMSHSSPTDNISRTFNDNTHREFWVASVNISANLCNTSINLYSNNVSNQSLFEEIALFDPISSTIVYVSILEDKAVGFNGELYDFQMIVPENGGAGWTGITTYYLYVELS